RAGKIVFVGDSRDARSWIGPHTELRELHGQLVMPGLFDSHIHPISTIPVENCNLDSAVKTLHEISDFVRACLKRYPVTQDGWLTVHQWNFSVGNQPDAEYPTIRAALDKASAQVAIRMVGNDYHHAAFNSAGLARAHDARGAVIGLSRATLASELK